MRRDHHHILTGEALSIRELNEIVKNPHARVAVSGSSDRAITRSHRFLLQEMKRKVLYGVNTGLGPMASFIIGNEQIYDLQKNLVRSHAAGTGPTISQDFVFAAMVARLNTFAKGYSGVSLPLVAQLTLLINKRIVPVVFEHGAVGTSGDLVQLAHIALALMGEGSVWYQGKRLPTAAVFKKLGIAPYRLGPKEGLALINGTAVMSGIAGVTIGSAERIFMLAIQMSAYAFELVHGFTDALSKELHETRPHQGQQFVAQMLRTLLQDSKLLTDRGSLQSKNHPHHGLVKEIGYRVQDVYSFRCVPQIIGPMIETFLDAKKTLEIELNSVTDNPIIDPEHKKIYHGGNFHGDYVATAVDQLKIGLVKLSLLMERRINFFLNKNVNKFLPPFLNLHTPGLTLGLQGLQFIATSTTAQNQSLGFPHSLHSISTNGDNQDVVSMGSDAALFTAKVLENTYVLLAIELIVLLQATDATTAGRNLSSSSRALYRAGRKIFPAVREDRSMSEGIDALLLLLKEEYPVDRLRVISKL